MGLNAQYTTTTPAFKLTTAPDSGYQLAGTDPSQAGSRPRACLLQATTHDIRFTVDGSAPTASVGMLLVAGADPLYWADPLVDLRFIQTQSGSVLNVTYIEDIEAFQNQGPPGVVQSVVAGNGIAVDSTDPANPVVSATGGGGGSSPIQSATVTLTAADLAVLDSVPFALVAAPGVGKVLSPLSWYMITALNGSGIGPASGAVYPYFDGSSTQQSAGVLLDTNGDDSFAYQPINYDTSFTLADSTNKSIVATASGPLPIPGAIATSSLNDGGTDYADGDTFTVDTGLGTLATGHVVSQTAGVVTAYALDTTPNGYLVGTGVATTATTGIGTGLLIDIDTLDYSANPMTLTVQTLYSVMDV